MAAYKALSHCGKPVFSGTGKNLAKSAEAMGELGCIGRAPGIPLDCRIKSKREKALNSREGLAWRGMGKGPWQWSHVSYVELQEWGPTFLPPYQTPHNFRKMGLESRWIWSLTSRSSSD